MKGKKLLLWGGLGLGAVLLGRKMFKSQLAGLAGFLGMGEDTPAADPNSTPGAAGAATPSSLPVTAVAPAAVGNKAAGMSKLLVPLALVAGVVYFIKRRKK